MKYFICPQVNLLDLRGKHVFITGGSKGIGRSVAIECCHKGANVSIVARNVLHLSDTSKTLQHICDTNNSKNGLAQGEGQEVRTFVLDVTNGYEDILSIVTEAERVQGPIDVLVNNAGNVMYQGPIENASPLEFERAFKLNVVSGLQLCKAVVPGMKQRRSGRIVLVSSAAGQIGIWGYSVYSPTKFALRGAAEALQMELSPYNVRVGVVYPPNTDTEGFKDELREMPAEIRAISGSDGAMLPMDVGKSIVRSIEDGSFCTSFGADGWMLSCATAGAAPETSPFRATAQCLFGGVFRFVLLAYHKQFDNVIWKLHKAKCD